MPYNQTPLTEPIKLSFWQEGRGTPLLLLHGFPLDHTIWDEQADDLRHQCRVIRFDLRGHGRSDAPEGAYSMDLLAQDVLDTLELIGVYKAIWVGHSMGGYLAMAAYRLAPERFSGFGLVASNHLADSPEARARRLETAEKVAQQGAAAAVNPKLFAETTPPDSPAVLKARRIMESTPPHGIIGSLLAMADRPDSTETLTSILVSSLVIAGMGDQLFKPEIARQMADLLPKSKLVLAHRSGHMPMLEEPGLVSEALADLVARVEAAST